MGPDEHVICGPGPDSAQQSPQGPSAVVGSECILSPADLGQGSLCRHGGHLEVEDLSLGTHGQGDGEGFSLGVFEGFEVIELEFRQAVK